ncbi:MAG: hypothetical protein ACRDPY_29325 [Streptosporangiaceae bacterium]
MLNAGSVGNHLSASASSPTCWRAASNPAGSSTAPSGRRRARRLPGSSPLGSGASGRERQTQIEGLACPVPAQRTAVGYYYADSATATDTESQSALLTIAGSSSGPIQVPLPDDARQSGALDGLDSLSCTSPGFAWNYPGDVGWTAQQVSQAADSALRAAQPPADTIDYQAALADALKAGDAAYQEGSGLRSCM